MARGLFRLVGVWSGCWVVRDVQIVQIVIFCAFNNKKTSAFCYNNNCVIINMHGKTTTLKKSQIS
jgi:hypothetical protein